MARGEVARMFVAIGADVREAVRAIEQVNGNLGQLQREARRSGDTWSGFTGTLARTGLAIQGVRDLYRGVRDLAGGIGSLALGADDDRIAMDQLIGSIQNTGRAIDDGLRKRLDDTIQSMEETTLFTDSDLRQALQQLVIGTGDVDEALRRLPISADLAAREQIELGQSSRMLARIDDQTLGVLGKYGIGLDDNADKAGDLAAAQLLAARAGITVSGAMKAVGNESIRKRWGIPDPKDMKGAINEAAILAKAKESLAGGATGAAQGLRGEWDQVGKGMKHVRDQLGELVLPLAKRGVRFLSDSLKGVRRLIMLFSTDVSGPRISGVRKLWKEIFGTEMPGALQAVVGGFTDIKTRIDQFVKDLNSTDEQTVRAAVKNLFEGLKTDIAKALSELGTELDKQGLAGIALKLGIASVVLEKTTGGILTPLNVLGFLRDVMQIAWFTVALGGSGLALTIAAGATLAIGALVIGNTLVTGFKSQDIWDKVLAPAMGGIIGVSAAFFAGLSAPVVITVGAVVALAFGAITFAPEIGDLIGGWWSDFQALWEQKKADFITSWNTNLPGFLPKIETPPSTFTPPTTVFTGHGDTDKGYGGRTASSPPATLDDIYAAYERITGGQISADYARQIRDQGFSYAQVAGGNVFAGNVTPDYAGNVRDFAMGGSGIVTQPTLFRAGERGAERYDFRPVGSSAGAAATGSGGLRIGPIVINGDVDSRERVDQVVDSIYRRARLAGLAV